MIESSVNHRNWVSVEPIGPERLSEYSAVPSVIEVKSVFAIGGEGRSGYMLSERAVTFPYTKDYDSYRHGRPVDWPRSFDISRWAFWIAADSDDVLGGAAVAPRSLPVLGDRNDSAGLWDIRVQPDRRRDGIGTQLFQQAAMWTKSEGYSRLIIETQNVNVAACRFYARMGCVLDHVNRHAYAQFPGIESEVMLVWELNLIN
jgi:GNAT superfamily N-acetyltransferase